MGEEVVISGLGASMTAGTPGFYSPRERPPHGQGDVRSQYAYWMMQLRPRWKVLNRGMRGQRTDQIEARFDYDVLDLNPHFLILIAGTNDLYQGYDVSWPLRHLGKMYIRAKENGIGVLSASVPPLGLADPELAAKILDFNREVRELAARSGAGFCDLYAALEDPLRPGTIAGSPDQIHPGVDGYRKMAEALTASLDPRVTLHFPRI